MIILDSSGAYAAHVCDICGTRGVGSAWPAGNYGMPDRWRSYLVGSTQRHACERCAPQVREPELKREHREPRPQREPPRHLMRRERNPITGREEQRAACGVRSFANGTEQEERVTCPKCRITRIWRERLWSKPNGIKGL